MKLDTTYLGSVAHAARAVRIAHVGDEVDNIKAMEDASSGGRRTSFEEQIEKSATTCSFTWPNTPTRSPRRSHSSPSRPSSA